MRFTNWMARHGDPNPADRPTPLICLCPTPDPEPCGQCSRCLRRIAYLMSPEHLAAAHIAYPELSEGKWAESFWREARTRKLSQPAGKMTT